MEIWAKITSEISEVILKGISEWHIPTKMAKDRLFTTLRAAPGFTFILSSFLPPHILQFIVNQKYLLSIYHLPGTVISAKDTLESETENSLCPQGAEGQWGDTDIK